MLCMGKQHIAEQQLTQWNIHTYYNDSLTGNVTRRLIYHNIMYTKIVL